MSETQRNFLILIAIAVVGYVFSSSFSNAAGVLMQLINLAFVLALGWFLYWLYKQRRSTISLMKKRWRLLLIGSGIVGYLVYVTGTLYPAWYSWSAGFAVVFFLLLAACAVGIYYAWQQRSWRW